MPYGRITSWASGGFGFISDDQAKRHSIFAHVTQLPGARVPAVGDAFSYELGRGARGKIEALKLQALSSAQEECNRVFGA